MKPTTLKGNWFPVPNRLIGWLADLSPTELRVWLVYARYQNMPDRVAHPGAGTIARLIGHENVRHVREAIASLERRGFIRTTSAGGGKLSARRRASIPKRCPADAAPVPKSGTTPRAEIRHPKETELKRQRKSAGNASLEQWAKMRTGAIFPDDPDDDLPLAVTVHPAVMADVDAEPRRAVRAHEGRAAR